MNKPREILLHVCCGPCATASVETLLKENWNVSLFYSNSNIYPKTEWAKRLEGVEKVAKYYNIAWFYDEYKHSDWLKAIKGLESEPERGQRCRACFAYNFQRASEKAIIKGCAGFTTSLSISPYKDSLVIYQVGNDLGNFIEYNFKKNNGYKRSIELSKTIGLYRQSYCGCEFSIR